MASSQLAHDCENMLPVNAESLKKYTDACEGQALHRTGDLVLSCPFRFFSALMLLAPSKRARIEAQSD